MHIFIMLHLEGIIYKMAAEARSKDMTRASQIGKTYCKKYSKIPKDVALNLGCPKTVSIHSFQLQATFICCAKFKLLKDIHSVRVTYLEAFLDPYIMSCTLNLNTEWEIKKA